MGRRQKKTAEIVELGPHHRMTPEECLSQVLRERPSAVMVIFERGEEGILTIRSSEMTRKDALWLLEAAKVDVLDFEDPEE